MHRFLSTVPFDLYQLALFRLVATQQRFTRAAEMAGLTQSAVTRQIKAVETSLGVDLLERTTRRVRVTPAGEFLLREAKRLLGDVDHAINQLVLEFAGARKKDWNVEPAMQLDNFDLIINLVALGMGVSFVPARALALYAQRSKLLRLPVPKPFTRELVVVVRRRRKTPEHIERFIDNVLF